MTGENEFISEFCFKVNASLIRLNLLPHILSFDSALYCVSVETLWSRAEDVTINNKTQGQTELEGHISVLI